MKDYFGYAGKVCVVTGAASGMGKATAEMLVDLGAKVYALDWATVNIEVIEKYICTDLSQKDSIDKAFEAIPQQIDSFFGIAGVSGAKCDFITTTKIDLISNKYICEEILVNRMSEGGSIAFMTSTAGIGWEKEGNKKEFDEVLKGLVDANEEILPFIDKINELVNSFSSLSKDDLEEFVDKEELENLVKSFNKTKNLKIEYQKLRKWCEF